MTNYLPSQLELPKKYNFFNLQFQKVNARIIYKHTKAIQKLCDNHSSSTIQRLSREDFWRDLKTKSKQDAKVEEIKQVWDKVKPLAHLNTKQILSLLQEHIIPLERGYQYTIAQFPDENIKSQLKSNLKRLKNLKTHVFEGLNQRCKAHKGLKSPRNVDDLVALLCNKINTLVKLDPPLAMHEKYSATLDDDRRLTIFDLLKANGVDENILHEEVLGSVPKRGHAPLRTQEEVKNELQKFNKFRNKVIGQLDLQGVGEYLFSATNNAGSATKSIQTLFNKATEKCKEIFREWSGASFLDNLTRMRYLLYIALCFGAYHYLIQLTQPIALLILNVATFNTIASVLFYTLGVAPLWYLGWICLNKAYSVAHNYLTCWKKQEILESLIVVEDIQHFISEKLSQIIIDLPHFDIKQLIEDVENCESELKEAKKSLKRFAPGERFLCKGAIQKQTNEVKAKIGVIQEKLKKRLKVLTTHIALRVGEDIELLDLSLTKDSLEPILPSKQLERLKSFVRKYGDGAALERFEVNANILNKWLEKLSDNQFVHKSQVKQGTLNQPWGGYDIRHDSLKGWDVILNAFAQDPIQKNACLKLNELLKGKGQVTPAQFKEFIKNLNAGDSANTMTQKIQGHLFNTLNAGSPQVAALLSQSHKDLISQWYQQHQKEINEARTKMHQVCSGKITAAKLDEQLKQMDNKELSKYYELLDGADIYYYATNQTNALKERQNSVRKFFENYQGDSSLAYRLINFVPKKEVSDVVNELAKKRLNWILGNLSKINVNDPFDAIDRALFNNSRLHKDEKFDFSKFVLQNPQFEQPWTQGMEDFLRACQSNGLDSGTLLSRYMERNEKVKPFILHQRERGKPAESCGASAQESPLNDHLRNRDGIRV